MPSEWSRSPLSQTLYTDYAKMAHVVCLLRERAVDFRPGGGAAVLHRIARTPFRRHDAGVVWEFAMLGKSKLSIAVAAIVALGASSANAQNILQLGGAKGDRVASSPGVARKSERGVTIYRGAKPVAAELAGGEPARATMTISKTIIVEHHYHSRIGHLRTQGFYSGHPGKSRRFTQGFYSGPVDRGRTHHCAHS